MISVVRRKLITSCSSVLTKAPVATTKRPLRMHPADGKEYARTYDSQAGKSQVLKRARFADSVQKRVKEKGDVSCEKGRPREGRQKAEAFQLFLACCSHSILSRQHCALHLGKRISVILLYVNNINNFVKILGTISQNLCLNKCFIPSRICWKNSGRQRFQELPRFRV